MSRKIRYIYELPEIEKGSEISEVIDKYNDLVARLNVLTKQLSLQSNFDGQVIDTKIPASSNIRVPHNLGIVPKYRLILRQEGNGLLTDIPLEWTDKYITIRNNGAVQVKATILLLKE